MRWIGRLNVRWRSLFRRGRLEQQMDAELQFHIAQLTAEYIAGGMSAEEARMAAARAFGSTAFVKDECRHSLGLRLLDETVQDLRCAARSIRKRPAFMLVAVLSLALGIGANTTIFTLLDAVVFKPLRVPAARELVTFYENGPEGPADAAGGTGRFLRFSYPRFHRLEEALGDHGSIAAVTRGSRLAARLPGAADRQFVVGQLVSGRYFSTLGVPAARGRVLDANDVRLDRASPVAVVSDGFWKRALGASDDVVGAQMAVNDVTITIVGVAPPGFAGMWTDSEADMWLPLTLQQPLGYANNSSSYGRSDPAAPWHTQDVIAWLNLVARVRSSDRAHAVALLQGANRAGLTDLASTFENPKERASMLAHVLVVEPFAHGFSGLRARYADALFALTGLVAVVLLVTCANIANLLLARAAGHARDVGIRIALGAGTGRLVRQCLAESLALALLGGGAGLAFGWWASAFLARQVFSSSGRLPMVFSPDYRVLLFAFGISFATAIAFGLAPAFRAIAAGRAAALGGQQRQLAGQPTPSAMRSLVIGQLALSVVVVFAALLFGRTLINFTRIDPGFATDRLVTVALDPLNSGYRIDQMATLAERLATAVRAVPGVERVAVSRCGLIAGCSSSSGFRLEGRQDRVSLNHNSVSAGYFRTTGIPIVEGREFDERDRAGSAPVAMINHTVAVRYFPGQDPVGHRMEFDGVDREIVGVVRDARTQSLHDPPVAMVYLPIEQTPLARWAALTNIDVRVDAEPSSMIATIRTALRRAETGLLVGNVEAMSAHLDRDLMRERLVAYLAFSFGALTLLLASIGLYGLLSYAVARRTQEIGVRMALGARPVELIRLVVGQGAGMAAIGLAFGIGAAAAGARYLSGMIFGVTPLDAASFAGVCVAVTAVTLLASWVPARRATRIDPLIALRSE